MNFLKYEYLLGYEILQLETLEYFRQFRNLVRLALPISLYCQINLLDLSNIDLGPPRFTFLFSNNRARRRKQNWNLVAPNFFHIFSSTRQTSRLTLRQFLLARVFKLQAKHGIFQEIPKIKILLLASFVPFDQITVLKQIFCQNSFPVESIVSTVDDRLIVSTFTVSIGAFFF